jgi:superfamily II DNA or RNA helicase
VQAHSPGSSLVRPCCRRDDIAELTAGYGLIIADECHHVPATAFEQAVNRFP